LENVTVKDYLQPYKVLFLTYEGQKPPRPELHDALAEWVKAGGVLVVVDADTDPYNSVKDWWNTAPMAYSAPRLHLFEKLGITGVGTHKVGEGAVIYTHTSPASLAASAEGAKSVVDLAKEACSLADVKWRETSYLMLRRGPYIIGAGLDETEGLPTHSLKGSFVDIFSPTLNVLHEVTLSPNTRIFLLDLSKIKDRKPKVLCSASKVLGVEVADHKLRFHSAGPEKVTCATRVLLPSEPKHAQVDGVNISCNWDAVSHTALLTYPNATHGHWVEMEW
jgi:hypothetical protein